MAWPGLCARPSHAGPGAGDRPAGPGGAVLDGGSALGNGRLVLCGGVPKPAAIAVPNPAIAPLHPAL